MSVEIVKNFNILLNEFICKMAKTFPEEQKIKVYYRMFEMAKKYNPNVPMRIFMGGCLEFEEQIKMRDSDFFLERDTFVKKCVSYSSFSDDLGLKKYWESLNDKTKDSIWDYVQTLYVLGEKYISNDNSILNEINDTYQKVSLSELKRFESSGDKNFSDSFINNILMQ